MGRDCKHEKIHIWIRTADRKLHIIQERSEVMRIISEIKVNGEWVRQETLPPELVAKIISETFQRAGRVTGFEVKEVKK